MPLFFANMIMKMLIKNISIIISIVLISFTFAVRAQADRNCYLIDDPDERALCLGLSGKDSCYQIDDRQMRQQCLGQTKVGSCYDIEDPQERALCLGKTG